MVMFLSCTSQSYKNKGKKKKIVAESSGLKNKTKQIKKKKKKVSKPL